MIGLNKIGLNQVQLNRLRLNAPFPAYGKMAGGGGSGDGFPQLPGDVTRWHFGGLTNEMMAAMDDPRIEDADHKGRFLSFKNFAWGGMSGVGGYKFNFKNSSEWNISVVQVKEHNDNRIVINNRLDAVQLCYKGTSIKIVIKLTGVEENNSRLKIYDDIDSSKEQSYNKDGIYEIDYIANDGANYVYFYITGGNYGELDLPITIEQLPLYPGFILGDGVDDEAATENLDLEDTYTVYTPLILLKYGGVVSGKSSAKDFSLNTVVSSKSIGFDSANAWSGSIPVDLFEFALVVCKRDPKTMYVKDLITGKANQSNSKEFVPNPGKYFIWRNTGGSWCQVAIAGQIICNGHFSTDEEDAKVLAWHKKQYPWLFPDQAWTVTGKTNEDEDRATIANITGNGNDLILSNFGFIEGSGYNEEGEYAGYLVTDGVEDKTDSSAFEMGEDFTVVGEWKLLSMYSYAGIVKTNNLYVYNNISTALRVYIRSGSASTDVDGLKSLKAICSDGRVYGEDWTEYKLSIGSTTGSRSRLYLGYNNTSYTQIAFKNLGIYNNQILSKDDCIKAYNYLQSLKAK